MKHRSVIAFVIVAAALFAAPQLSHDLQALKGAVGSRLHRELLHAFLNLPATEAAISPVMARPAQTLLASCPKENSNAPATKAAKSPRVDAPATERQVERRAMITDPGSDPIGQLAELKNGAARGKAKAATLLPEVHVDSEVAMIIPPDSGIDPHGLASLLASKASLGEAMQLRKEAEGLRMSYVTTRLEGKGAEWQKATDEAIRSLNLRGTYEFRFEHNGAKAKALKVRCADCPAPAPRAARAPRQVATFAPLPVALGAPALFGSE